MKRVEVYKDGKVIGPNLMFHKSGKLKRKQYVSNRFKSNFEYTEEGKLTRIKCHEKISKFDDRKESVWCGFNGGASDVKLFNRKGVIHKYVSYHKGKMLKYSNLNDKGVAVKTKNFAIEKRNNIELSKYNNGTIKQEKRYNKKGLLDGIQKEFSKEGTLVREALFEKGFMKFEKIYYLNKELKIKTTRHKNGNIITAEKLAFWDNGKKSFHGSFIESRQGHHFGFGQYYSYRMFKRVGEHREWSEKGSLLTLEHYKDGKFDGEQIYYYLNSKPRLKQYYKDGDIYRKIKYDNQGKLTTDDQLHRDGSIKK